MADARLTGLLALLDGSAEFEGLAADLAGGRMAAGDEPLSLQLLGAARPFVVAALAARLERPVTLLAARPEQAIRYTEQLAQFLPDPTRLWAFPDPGALPYERAPWSSDRVQRRLAVLTRLVGGGVPPVLVTDARAVLYPTVPRAQFEHFLRRYRRGQQISLRFLLASWYAMGYEQVTTVIAPGQYAHRGGILDIFPAQAAQPVRIELWGDEIDSLRTFDPLSQRSYGELDELVVPPATEALLHRSGAAAAERLRGLETGTLSEAARDELLEDAARLEREERFEGIERYLPYLYDQPGGLLEYLPDDTLLLVDDWNALELNVEQVESEALTLREERIGRGELPDDFTDALLTWDHLREEFQRLAPVVLGYGTGEMYGLEDLFVNGPRYGGRLNEAIGKVRERIGSVTQILLSRQAERLSELLRDEGVVAPPLRNLTEPPSPRTLVLVNGALGDGFEFHPEGAPPVALITDAELFGWSRAATRRPLRPRRRAKSDFFAEITEGDYVVHTEHGIGLYRGLVQREINGITREYLELEYAQGDRLYVPVHQADRVARYLGAGDRDPSIHRLGTADWESARRRARRAVEEIADELLDLYAARATAKGYAFAPDTPWQAELEASFPYTETDDQLDAIAAVKRDMESEQPMDRLIIGDVGFGKTEVALRATFKAVLDGKQVAMLVPTTVLAQQHFTTFSQRLSAFPVNVEMLSRFRSQKEQREILEQLASGAVDVIIGTHRLLSKDVAFKDLGLVIIDEEQRFGVTHKERFKQLRREVDVLTLTATPIPRTLHMALTGARDMSTIDTPPEERLPILTRVIEWDEDAIRRAILLEIDRGGQVFFVHNRVMSIHAVAQKVSRLVPEARLAVAHGQMNESELERVMVEFAEGAHDVLVCTSIIESGLDLPNVNTIIVDRSDMFGLAQLYQLRGRVGRGARRGYAYFVHPRASQLTPEAFERLEVMQEASELGAGFRVAMKDLEIRGAGELLGARQSGNIAAVGFDMYTKLLAQAIREKREARQTPGADSRRAREATLLPQAPAVDLPLQAYLPEAYIADEEVRLQLYRRMAEAVEVEQVEEIERELRDRFGPLPDPAAHLVYVLRLRALAALASVNQLGLDSDTGDISILLPGPGPTRRLEESGLLANRVRFGRRALFIPRGSGPEAWMARLEEVMAILAARDGEAIAV